MYKTRYVVRFDDVDAAGIVYFPRYFHVCHLAFEDFFNDNLSGGYHGLINDRQIGFPTVHVDADFKSPIFYGDIVRVQFLIKNIGNSSVKSEYCFYRNQNPDPVFTASIVVVLSDLKRKKSVEIPKDIKEILLRFQ